MLITTLSDEMFSLLTSLHMHNDISDKTSKYESLIKLLDDHFTPVKSYFQPMVHFMRSENWPVKMSWGFSTDLDIMLRDKFVLGPDRRLVERLPEEDDTHLLRPSNCFG